MEDCSESGAENRAARRPWRAPRRTACPDVRCETTSRLLGSMRLQAASPAGSLLPGSLFAGRREGPEPDSVKTSPPFPDQLTASLPRVFCPSNSVIRASVIPVCPAGTWFGLPARSGFRALESGFGVALRPGSGLRRRLGIEVLARGLGFGFGSGLRFWLGLTVFGCGLRLWLRARPFGSGFGASALDWCRLRIRFRELAGRFPGVNAFIRRRRPNCTGRSAFIPGKRWKNEQEAAPPLFVDAVVATSACARFFRSRPRPAINTRPESARECWRLQRFGTRPVSCGRVFARRSAWPRTAGLDPSPPARAEPAVS